MTTNKLIVVPEGQEYNDAQIRALTEFQERFFDQSSSVKLPGHYSDRSCQYQ